MAYFTRDTLRFLADLGAHNERAWFERNRERYEEHVKDPALRLIAAVEPKLGMRGKLMRVHRDMRFAKDEKPYKTNIGVSFHPKGAPRGARVGGVYLHVTPEESFVGTGCWMPEAGMLAKIRRAIDRQPAAWRTARRVGIDDAGDSLRNPPPGFSEEHPFVEDLKRRSFTSSVPLSARQATSTRLPALVVGAERKMRPLNRFLARAIA